MFTVRFPGQGSDGPGIVRVFDPAGRMLKQFALDWLGDAEPVYEGSHCATIHLQPHGSEETDLLQSAWPELPPASEWR
jgi:hypothetical protein